MEGYIKLHRQILESSIFASQIGFKIWIWCLLKANFKDKYASVKIGKGESQVHIKRGSFIFGRFKAEDELNIDGSTIYKWIKKLEEENMLFVKSNSHYSVVTICKYDEYQQQDNDEVATIQQPFNNQVATIQQQSNTTKNDKNDKNDKKRDSVKNFTPPTLSEVVDYFLQNEYSEESARKAFDYYEAGDWYDSKNNKVKRWKQKMQAVWFKDENKINQQKSENKIPFTLNGLKDEDYNPR